MHYEYKLKKSPTGQRNTIVFGQQRGTMNILMKVKSFHLEYHKFKLRRIISDLYENTLVVIVILDCGLQRQQNKNELLKTHATTTHTMKNKYVDRLCKHNSTVDRKAFVVMV